MLQKVWLGNQEFNLWLPKTLWKVEVLFVQSKWLAAQTGFFVITDDTLPLNISNETLIYGEEIMFPIVPVFLKNMER